MRSLVPDFIGERLTEAREARGLNQRALADLLGVSRQAVSQYEKGTSSPSGKTLEAISSTLRFPATRFIRPMPRSVKTAGFFRSLSSATKTARVRAEKRYDCLRNDICYYLRKRIDFVDVKFPDLELDRKPHHLSFDDIEEIAAKTRRYFGLGDGPISDVVRLLENHGAIVVRNDLGAETLDAFSKRSHEDGRPYIILGTEKASAVRSRFDAAHELGHIVIHANLTHAEANHPDYYNLWEKQAHYFAKAFLMPANTFRREFRTPSLDALLMLKQRWKVSIGAMIMWAADIGLINEYRKERLFVNRTKRWGKKWEPLDDELKPELPQFIARSFDLLMDHGAATKESVEAATELYAEDIESFAGLPDGFFGDEVEHFKFPTLNDDPRPADRYTPSLFEEDKA